MLGLCCSVGFSVAVVSRGCSLVVLHGLLTGVASHWGGFSCRGPRALGHEDFSNYGFRALELNRCGAWA